MRTHRRPDRAFLPPLDPKTLLFVNVVNQIVLATVIPLIMGQRLSAPARHARLSMISQGIGWGALALAGVWKGQWPDWLLSSIAMCFIALSLWRVFLALEGWLGPRPWKRTLAVICIAMPLGYALSFQSYPIRVGWANLLIALQSLIVARAALFPSTQLTGRWRWALAGSFLVMATLTAARGILGAFFTEMYPYFTAPTPVNILALLFASTMLAVGDIALMIGWHEESDLELQRLAVTDPLTGVLNRHGWNSKAQTLISDANRIGFPVALLVIDLDHFKQINDRKGHAAGDDALRLTGRVIRDCARAQDVVARMGGEEFCLLLPDCDARAGRAIDARLRQALEGASSAELGEPLRFSSGLAMRNEDSEETLDTLMRRADAALYRAKGEGRDRLIAAG